MTKLTIYGKEYKLEFRHVRPKAPAGDGDRRSPGAITTCVIVADDFIAIDNAVCANGDNFSRRTGRLLALKKVVTNCGALREMQQAFLSQYIQASPPKPVKVRRPLSEAVRQARIDAGLAKRMERSEHA